MAILRGLLVLFVLYGIFLSGNTQNVTDETTVAEDTTTEAVTSVATETSTAMEADTTVSTTTVTVAMVTNETTTAMMTTTTEPETDQTTMETTTMYIPMTTLAPITSTNCTRDENCTALDSICNTTIGVCQCKDDFVLVNDTICSTVDAFKVTIRFENITDNSIIVNWETLDISGVDVNYEIMFNSSVAANISSPPVLIKNLTDGEVHSVQVKSIVKGRDDRVSFTQSDMTFVRTAPLTPVFNNTIHFIAPNVTIMWTPRNPDVDLYYIYLKGHDTMPIPSSTNETSLTVTNLKPGRNYMLTVIQQTGGPYASNSSEAILNIRTQSTEPGPPEAVEVVDIGQRNISINVTDTDMPNGDITGYRLLIMYKLYPDEMEYMVKMVFLKKTMSNIYVIKRHIYPGAQYRITVFTVNDAFNSSLNSTLQEITTLPDTPGQVDRPSNINQTTTSAVITWHRPLHPNGNMKAYRAVLESGPEISNCRIYYLCVDACNNTILGPPNNTCTISNDTSLMENQKIMYLLVDNLRIGTTYTLSVVGYNEAGEGKTPQSISLTTKSIRPDPVDVGTFYINTSRRIVTWTPPAFAGEDLKYSVTFKDAFFGTIAGNTEETAAPTYNLPNNLHYYYNYTVVVTAKTSNGSANPSQQTFTTPYGGKLGAPQKIKIKNDDCEKILITWFEPAIRARNGPITGYQFTNTLGNQKWDYGIIGPEYWATQNKQFSYELPISENTVYSIEIHAVSSITNQEGNSYGTKRFQSIQCPVDNTPEIVLIVFAFLILLGICLAVIIYVYRKKVREIEETYINNPPRPAPGERGLTPIVDEEIELNRPFILSDAQKAFEEKSADSYRLFLMEYDDIKKLSQIEGRKRTTNAANIDANKAKNRYVNILSYDHSRVKLRMIDDDPCSDYVNANYIIGYTYEREYIASQGPLPGTVNDFWRMTWEQSVTIIVMLTKCKEGNTDKCEHYWPDTVNEPKQYGDIVVNLISVSNMDKFDINIFQVSQGDYTRTIKHFHFLEWPDFSAAVDSTVVIDFIQTVRTHITPEVKGPLLIHCSAGVGRTGTYISIDYLLQFVRDHDLGQPVDIFAWVVQMRKNRVSMVQVDKQYIFIHRALTELIDRKRNGLLQSQDDTTILNEIVYENTAFQSDDDEEEEEEEDEDEESDAMYENSMKKVPDQHITEL